MGEGYVQRLVWNCVWHELPGSRFEIRAWDRRQEATKNSYQEVSRLVDRHKSEIKWVKNVVRRYMVCRAENVKIAGSEPLVDEEVCRRKHRGTVYKWSKRGDKLTDNRRHPTGDRLTGEIQGELVGVRNSILTYWPIYSNLLKFDWKLRFLKMMLNVITSTPSCMLSCSPVPPVQLSLWYS